VEIRRRRRARQVDRPAHPIQIGDRAALGRIGDDDEVPLLAVPSCGRLERNPQALLDDRPLHRPIEVEPLANGPRGGQKLIGIELEQ
jgi:hypothetical protein